MKRVRAAVVPERGAPFEFVDLLLDDPRPDEVRVRIVAAGLCHTDLGVQAGHLPTLFPVVLGHEGAGVVEAVGDAVRTVGVGDRVALSFSSCGRCPHCLTGRRSYCVRTPQQNLGGTRSDGSTRLSTLDGTPVNGSFFGQSSFATHCLVSEYDVVKLPDDAPLTLAGPLGCGVQTGVGTVLNSLAVPAGASVLVTGAGAVGLSAVMGAVLAGATTIIAVDVVEERLALARELGATHTFNSSEVDLVREVRRLTGGGTSYAVDTTGVPAVVEQVLRATVFGGSVALVGVSKPGASIDLGLVSASGRTVVGAIEGDSVPQTFVPQMLALHAAGQLPVEKLVRTYPFDELATAVADTTSGRSVKAVLLFEAADF
ncbi:NAD(P)-dependent alcohol dehydrogenase [Nocardioides yefusunii]|uniref:NAD(P)-dependent alcohol dehydrogenase n=1 Tax=Nocardioides yefusunii TaxID=2500546 RepID=A0ABW1QZJ7_9ACTN|nr:NAD(P)-dependent alcohol dehydrogenase [Nocardioides yefusunii]